MHPAEPWPGGPDAIWAASANTAPAPRPPAPDVTGFDDFVRRAAPSEPGLFGPVVFAVLGAIFLVYAFVFRAYMPEFPDDVDGAVAVILFLAAWNWLGALALGVWCLITAPRTYYRDRRDHPGEVRALYAASLDRGVVCELFPTGFKVLGGDGWDPTVIGVDARLDEAAAARVRRAFADWFAAVEGDKRTDREVAHRHNGRDVLPAEEVFGREAEGGYLIRGDYRRGRWALLIADPPATKRSWSVLAIGEEATA
ncbi:hypothetical protein [Glycomyces arizonensis]|uniref:hypothetical protein n=1 Tax=Glycomyces arizonensis TaxID=256035 RepID=UPI00041A50B2|nr:hypothetical protein [Glycomyces arizonensis]